MRKCINRNNKENLINKTDQMALMAFIRIMKRVTFDWLTLYFPHLFSDENNILNNKFGHILWIGLSKELIDFLELPRLKINHRHLRFLLIIPKVFIFHICDIWKIDYGRNLVLLVPRLKLWSVERRGNK